MGRHGVSSDQDRTGQDLLSYAKSAISSNKYSSEVEVKLAKHNSFIGGKPHVEFYSIATGWLLNRAYSESEIDKIIQGYRSRGR